MVKLIDEYQFQVARCTEVAVVLSGTILKDISGAAANLMNYRVLCTHFPFIPKSARIVGSQF
jgi:hypothetical protein